MPPINRRVLAISVITVFLLSCCVPTLLLAQSLGDDVHITPRPKPVAPAPASPLVDAALKAHDKPLKVDVDLVLVPVTITDPMNRLVTGLDKENFNILEGKEPQEIRHFSSEDAPVSLGVIFDLSGSMNSKIDRAREAIIEFFKTANPQDEFFLITFADKPEQLSDFTNRSKTFKASWSIPSRKDAPPCSMPFTLASTKCIRRNIRNERC